MSITIFRASLMTIFNTVHIELTNKSSSMNLTQES